MLVIIGLLITKLASRPLETELGTSAVNNESVLHATSFLMCVVYARMLYVGLMKSLVHFERFNNILLSVSCVNFSKYFSLHFCKRAQSISVVPCPLLCLCTSPGQNGADVNAKDMLKMTALHWAAEHSHKKVAELLLEHGADVHALSKFDKTPFDISLDRNNAELMLMLQVMKDKQHNLASGPHSGIHRLRYSKTSDCG